MKHTVFKGMQVTDEDIFVAMEHFDKEHRLLFNNWRNYAVQHDGKLYPPKKILSLATGENVSVFVGGEPTNRIFGNLGFNVIELNKEGRPDISSPPVKKNEQMLTESDVIESVCKYLEGKNYTITQKLNETQKGDDIIAKAPDGCEVYIEAKGETSSKSNTKRHGKPFDSGQCKDHVATAFFRAAQMLQRGKTNRSRVGIALPKTEKHSELVRSISQILKKLYIEVFFVDHNREVDVANYWQT